MPSVYPPFAPLDRSSRLTGSFIPVRAATPTAVRFAKTKGETARLPFTPPAYLWSSPKAKEDRRTGRGFPHPLTDTLLPRLAANAPPYSFRIVGRYVQSVTIQVGVGVGVCVGVAVRVGVAAVVAVAVTVGVWVRVAVCVGVAVGGGGPPLS